MERFEKMGVFLKDAPTDDAVLAFAGHIAKLGVRQVYCIHVHDAAPGGVAIDPDVSSLEAKIRQTFPAELAEHTKCEVRHGSNLVEVLKAARDLDMGLIIIGRRLPSSQMSLKYGTARIVRKAPCNVLVVPELCTPHFSRILVAVDRSKHAKLALEAAVDLVKASDNPNAYLTTVSVRNIDARHNLAGATFKDAAEAQRQFAERDLAQFLAGVDTQGVRMESIVAFSDKTGAAIAHVAMASKMDILVIGSRGATKPAAVFLGSKSEDLLMSCTLPTLVVKEKGETLRLIEAIFALD